MTSERDRVLADTNVWVDFMRGLQPTLRLLLEEGRVLTHSCVIGEIFVGTMARRADMAEFFATLPSVPDVEFDEALVLLESRRLWGRGLQWNDVLILAAARVSDVPLWTFDRRLADAAVELGIAWHA